MRTAAFILAVFAATVGCAHTGKLITVDPGIEQARPTARRVVCSGRGIR